ncbi:helix-turn-helix domain-containing protein [Nocardioides daphniae]|uniref:Helix-turn-helix domain-containing protein n=1 Tax=Nocardioides daphniae TaxID=402297 RepID=A0A4P7UBU0_9ACTN|nr:helix-turn-helix domain-containing protein [Nocardioides daphniae]QCC77466.1 helix-turn-helix domain-containing protein [Nocardioides daphniae]
MNTADNTAEQLHDDHVVQDTPGLSLAGEIVEVRRNSAVAAVVGTLASGVAIAWFGRAISSASVGDWILVALMGGLGALWLATLVDARTPLLVADDQGCACAWAAPGWACPGRPWSGSSTVPGAGCCATACSTSSRTTPTACSPRSAPRPPGTRASPPRMYGGPLALPLGLGTRVVGAGDDLTAGLDRLASRGAEVVVVGEAAPVEDETTSETWESQDTVGAVDAPAAAEELAPTYVDEPAESLEPVERSDDEASATTPRTRSAGLLDRARAGVTALVTRRGRDDSGSDVEPVEAVVVEGPVEDVLARDVEPSETPAPVRSIVAPSRSEAVSSVSAPASDDTQLMESAEVDFFEEDQTWGERVRPIAREGQPVAPVVVDDFVVEPAQDPVVGPELRAARTRLGLTTDQLAERTRIRPHVIEAIEVDDFVPCGGDFYARGHLRTLARVLGIDVAPLLVSYDERYANAPIDPRRVFEAELATGSHGSIRGTKGGPNWSILVAVVMALVLAWSVARLVMDAPQGTDGTPVLNGSGGPGGVGNSLADPVKVKVAAPTSGAEVVVRDAGGSIVFQGDLAIGESTEVKAAPPVRVQASDGSVTVSVAGKKRGAVGEAGEPAQGTYAD